jgi:hypothetical protein
MRFVSFTSAVTAACVASARATLAAGLLFAMAPPALAQGAGSTAAPSSDDWKVAVYPVFAWVPLGIGIDVDVPPTDGGGGGGGGKIVDGRFDGAFLGGFSVAKGRWRVDANGLWAAVGGDRPEHPKLTVDVDAGYAHAMGGFRIHKNLYVTGGLRRYVLKYDVKLADQPNFSRKPGLWDPLVGVGWHQVGRKLELHATFEGGGFGVGADVDVSASFRVDWKPISHFGITGGYNVLYFKASDTVLDKTFTVSQSLHGPVAGIGFYF